MAEFSLRGTMVNTAGDLPEVGTRAPEFTLTRTDMAELSLGDVKGKKLVLNMFPSLDTPVCANSVREFNKTAVAREDTLVLCISADLPFAQARFCGAEGLEDVLPLSTFRNPRFGTDYGVVMVDGPLAGLLARSVLVIDDDGVVRYREQLPEIAQEPDYAAALAHL